MRIRTRPWGYSMLWFALSASGMAGTVLAKPLPVRRSNSGRDPQQSKVKWSPPEWRVGQHVEYAFAEAVIGKPTRWEIALVGVAGPGAYWHEMRVADTRGHRMIVKMPMKPPTKQSLLADPTRFFFGVSSKCMPAKLIVQAPGQPPVIVSRADKTASWFLGPTAVPPMGRWQVSNRPTVVERCGRRLSCTIVTVPPKDKSQTPLEMWYCHDVPITGLVRFRYPSDSTTTDLRLESFGFHGGPSLMRGTPARLKDIEQALIKTLDEARRRETRKRFEALGSSTRRGRRK